MSTREAGGVTPQQVVDWVVVRKVSELFQQTGRKIVRVVCSGRLERLDPRFWALDAEVQTSRELVISYLRDGWMDVALFPEFGLDNHIPYIASSTKKNLPLLREAARARLFAATSQRVQADLAASHPNIYVALHRLVRDQSSYPTSR